ncbi:MAG: glucose 1-dehydrogenase [Syntrophaceae bacterium]
MKNTAAPDFKLTGKVALVTGAGRGIGRDIALALAEYGADVAVCSRTPAELDKVRDAIEKLGRRALAVKADVTRITEIQGLVDKVAGAFGRIDILVNNAGINIPQFAVDVTEEAWDRIMDINLKGLFFCAQAVGKVMIAQKGGKIINISSQTGTVAIPKRAAYCASKGGVNQLTKLLALEWAEHGINVNAVAPTFIETPFTEPMFRDKEFRRFVDENIPLGRVGKPSDVTGAVVYLASSASDLVTGLILLVDGGWTIH